MSTPVKLLKPNTWSKDRFSSIRTNRCSIRRFGRLRLPSRPASARARLSRAHRMVSHALQTSCDTHPHTTQMAFTIQAKALQTRFATQYHALQTHFATQYHALQKKPATQFQGVYQWHFSHEVHWFEPSSAH